VGWSARDYYLWMNIKDVSSALGVGKARACWVKFYPTNQTKVIKANTFLRVIGLRFNSDELCLQVERPESSGGV